MKRRWSILTIILIVAVAGIAVFPAANQTRAQKLVFGYISPGPDTWYQRNVDGFKMGAEKYGVEVIVLNSQYDTQKEIENIDSLINQGVDGISMFSFNENGANIAADKGAKAGIPVVVTDNVGQVIEDNKPVVSAIDFDWTAMGVAYAEWMAENYPGEDYVIITGNFESIPCQKINAAMEETSKKLGKNKLVTIRDADYDPNKAVNVAQDLLESGEKFSIMFIMDEDMAAAVIRMLKTRGVLNNPIKVIAQNGSPAGLPLLKEGSLLYTISSSPGWEGLVAFLSLYRHVTGELPQDKKQYMLPIIPVTQENMDDKHAVVPWEIDPIYWELTAQYFPELVPDLVKATPEATPKP